MFCAFSSLFSGRGASVGAWEEHGHVWGVLSGITLGIGRWPGEKGERDAVPVARLSGSLRNAGQEMPGVISCLLDTKSKDLEGCLGSPEKRREKEGERGGLLIFPL